MKTTTTSRDFVRNFARLKKIAANGGEIVVRDRFGQVFVFKSMEAGAPLSERLADLRGAITTGIPRKSLEGFGRNRP